MRADHPDPRLFERFLRGDTSPAENQAVVAHLLRRCPECQRKARAYWYRTEAPRARMAMGGLEGG